MIFATAEDVGDVGEYDDARERDSLLAFVSSLNDVARLARRCDLGVGGAGIDVCRDVNTWLNESSTSGAFDCAYELDPKRRSPVCGVMRGSEAVGTKL